MATDPEDQSPQPALAVQIGKAIADARKKAGLSAVKLSERTGIHRVAITKIEQGERDVTIPELVKLARALTVPPIQLIYPGLPDRSVEAWPGVEVRAIVAAQWFSGETTLFDDGNETDLSRYLAGDSKIGRARKIRIAETDLQSAARRAAKAADDWTESVRLTEAGQPDPFADVLRHKAKAEATATVERTDREALTTALTAALAANDDVDLGDYPESVQDAVTENLRNLGGE